MLVSALIVLGDPSQPPTCPILTGKIAVDAQVVARFPPPGTVVPARSRLHPTARRSRI